MPRVEMDDWINPRAASSAPSGVVNTDPDDLRFLDVNLSDGNPVMMPVEEWDGTTTVTATKTYTMGDHDKVGTSTEVFASNDSTIVTPVVGPGTDWFKMPTSLFMRLIYGAKLLTVTTEGIDFTAGMTINQDYINSSPPPATLPGAVTFSGNIAIANPATTGIESTDLANLLETDLRSARGRIPFNRWSTFSELIGRVGRENWVNTAFLEPLYETGTATGAINGSGSGLIYDLVEFGGQVTPVGNQGRIWVTNTGPAYNALQIADDPAHIYVKTGFLCNFGIRLDAFGDFFALNNIASISFNTDVSRDIVPELLGTTVIERTETTTDSYDPFDIPLGTVQVDLVAMPDDMSLTLFGEESLDYVPSIYRAEINNYVDEDRPISVTIDSDALSGNIDIIAYKYWPYKDADGNPLYDEDTGERI
jgi:hypothetical protein